MRLATNKSTLKNKLKVELTARSPPKTTHVLINGSVMLWVVHWTSQGTFQEFVDNFVEYVAKNMKDTNVYFVCDRYVDYIIKCVTR